MSIRVGVLEVIHGLKKATGADDSGLKRLYAAGGGPAAAVGKTADGQMMVPAISLYYFVRGVRALLPDATERLISYLVSNFDEIIYI